MPKWKKNFSKRGGSRHNKNKPYVRSTPRNSNSRADFTANKWNETVSITEKEIGITEYINENPGFSAVIKARYADFQVNEIDPSGNVLSLKSTKIPPRPVEDQTDATDEERSAKLIELITLTKYNEIVGIMDKGKHTEEENVVEIDVTCLSKEDRTVIHNSVKNQFGKKIVTTTFDRDEKKYIKCARYNSGNQGPDRRAKWLWPGEYTYFVVVKQNIDTLQAASELAHNLSCKASSIVYAGTKDKRAVTTQMFCLKKTEPERIDRAARKCPGLIVGDYTFHAEPLKLGCLSGNRFKIVLRQVEGDESTIESSLESLKEHGFINYYGLQRFGNSSAIPTHKIGEALIKGDFKEACLLILKPRDGEQKFMAKIREFWWNTRNSKATMEMFDARSMKYVEARLISGMCNHGANDFANPLESIPRNNRLLYVHAYQSLIWNQMVSKRIRNFGLKPIVGDLVYRDDISVDVEIDVMEGGESDETVIEQEIKSETESIFKNKVKPLTQEDIDSGKYNLCDIVLPLPGHDITYPPNEIGDWYVERLAEDDLTSEKLKSKHKCYSLTGSYRKIVTKPMDVIWRFVKYKTQESIILPSDFDKLKSFNKSETVEKNEEDDGNQTALVLEFNLPTSTYATMALREIIKLDTSVSNQIRVSKESVDPIRNDDTNNDDKVNEDEEENEQPDSKKAKIE